MNTQFLGAFIKEERLKNHWSQEGLCKDICTVSYLSKIEQGKAEASTEVLQLLLKKLQKQWFDDDETIKKVNMIIEDSYDAIFSANDTVEDLKQKELEEHWEICVNGPYMLDAILLKSWFNNKDLSIDEYEHLFNPRQRSLWLILKERFDLALQINPTAFTYMMAGNSEYSKGNYLLALEHLQHGFDLAAKEGLVYVMLHCSVILGNCYSNMMNFERMSAHYKIATRLATAVSDEDTLNDILYNTASTNLELGNVHEAYAYFSKLSNPNAMTLHKLAICCEKLGKTEEAFHSLKKAGQAKQKYPNKDIVNEVCSLVKYRLEHPDYLDYAEYGVMLLSCFEHLRKELPSGYAGFHLPWIIEWYKAKRQYKQIYELLRDFPGFSHLSAI